MVLSQESWPSWPIGVLIVAQMIIVQESNQSFVLASKDMNHIFWVHIPKTSTLFATTVLCSACGAHAVSTTRTPILTRVGPPQMLDDCGGNLSRRQCCGAPAHTPWFHDPLQWPEIGFPDDVNVVVLFREPAQRLISAFLYLKKMQSRCCGRGWGWGGDAFQSSKYWQANLTMSQFLDLPGVRACQTKMLIGRGCMHSELPTLAEVHRAVDFVRHYATFIGLSDFYRTSVCLWHARFGGVMAPAEKIAFQLSGRRTKYNITPLNDFVDLADEVIYSAAKQRFKQDLLAVRTCGEDWW
jgi:hypothetical protein